MKRRLLLLSMLAGCASIAPPLPELVVGREKFTLAGREARTASELNALLVEMHFAAIDIRVEAGAGADYEQIGRAIYSTTRHGSKINKVAMPPQGQN